MKIFIGSSTNYAPLNEDGTINRTISVEDWAKSSENKLQKIFVALLDLGHSVRPWWSNEIWPPGDSFFDSIRKAAMEHDAGVFIFGGDDEISICDRSSQVSDSSLGDNKGGAVRNSRTQGGAQRKAEKILAVTRDSVIFEFGLFIGTKGHKRTLIIFDEYREDLKIELKRMSDLHGISYPELNAEDLGEQIRRFFKSPSEDDPLDPYRAFVNTDMLNSFRKGEHSKWGTKALYVGSKSADIWESIESNDNYVHYVHFFHDFVDQIETQMPGIGGNLFKEIDNIISFGAGDGTTDVGLVQRAKSLNNAIRYVPVDINPFLASMAARKISDDCRVDVPFRIIDDFEVDSGLISQVIKENAHKIGHRNLFMMLGATFSNTDRPESILFNKMFNWMGEEDFFILDVNIYDDKADEKLDYAKQLEEILLCQDLDKPAFLNLLVNGLVGKHPEAYRFLNPANLTENARCSELIRTVDEQGKTPIGEVLYVEPLSEEVKERYTLVKDTKVLACRVKGDPNKPHVCILRRYRFESILSELERHFEVLNHASKDGDENVNRALFLLRRKR